LVFTKNFFLEALNSKDEEVIGITLKILQKLVRSGDLIGEALVPYYRQILPILNMYKNKNTNLGDHIEYSQRKRLCIGDLIIETLEAFEETGGEVFIYIFFNFIIYMYFLKKIENIGCVYQYKIYDPYL